MTLLSNHLYWLLLTVIMPALCAVLSWVVPKAWIKSIACVTAVASFVGSVVLLVSSTRGQWFGLFGIDPLSDVFLFMVTSIYATSVWYSSGYLKDVREAFLSERMYYSLLGMFAFTMLFSLSVSDLGIMWVGVEGTTVASALLIILERKKTSVEAAWRYTLIASAGLTLVLLGLLFLYNITGTLDIFALAADPPAFSLAIALVVAICLVGYGTKVGVFPMHTWLPDAHSEAPSPVSALFSGLLLPTALYAFLRIYAIVPVGGAPFLQYLVITFGVVTSLIAAFLMQRQKSYKRLLAYSSMEVMGLAMIGVGVGGVALYGALLLVVTHAFAKSAAFYCAGNVLRKTGTNQMASVRDLRHRMPWTSAAWMLSGLAVTGTPPFGTFIAEMLIIVGALAFGLPLVAILVIVAILLAFLAVNYQLGVMIFETSPLPNPPVHREPIGGTVLAFINVGVTLALGIIYIPYFTDCIMTATILLGGSLP
jgi:hydrogenase-4 component F